MPQLNQKDYFSQQAGLYAAFRPIYPQQLYDFLLKHVDHRLLAWDCATGNAQVASELAKHFDVVNATDISRKQLDEGPKIPNVEYSISRAEETTFADNWFDLITVGQAIHWFDRVEFYKEVNRVGKRVALLPVWGYS